MADKTLDQNPKITDNIIFNLETPDINGCFLANPYKVDKVVIYFVERDFVSSNYGSYTKTTVDPTLLAKLQTAQTLACTNPTTDNLNAVKQLQSQIAASSQSNTFYYDNALPVYTLGDSLNPAWLSTDTANSYLSNTLDANGNIELGKFQFTWSPQGSVREGDYFICWTWTPLPAGDSLSNNIVFSLAGDPGAVLSIPTHQTAPDKYNILVDRYLPEMFKMTVSNTDITPQTLQMLQQAIAQGFTDLEDLANQIIDLYDANAVHESLLVYLADLFNLKLKSQDATLWRRQIKEAIPLFKMKGTLKGLTAAFAQAGMTLNKFTRLWQIVSPYTWQESFLVTDSPSFVLAKNIVLPINQTNFKLWIRRANSVNYIPYSSDYVVFTQDDCGLTTTMTWIGNELSANPTFLHQGDYIRVLYQYNQIPAGGQAVENYIQQLPLGDTRDEELQEYPRKNWNVRLIEEDDPMFDTIVPNRQPFFDPVVFGKVRTEFPFSENIYNMDTYNGSARDTTDPCMIDKDFIDPCTACVSSFFNIDVSVQDISNERVMEINDILAENTPFHAMPYLISFSGEVDEFVRPPVEDIEFIIQFTLQEYILSGEASPIFNRTIGDGVNIVGPSRSDLADEITMVSNRTGTAYNNYIMLIAPNTSLANVGIDFDNHFLQVLSPSPNTGTYKLSNASGDNAVVVSTVAEPLNQSMFTFNLYNILYTTSIASITQDNLNILSDTSIDFTIYSPRSNWDIGKNGYAGGAWSVLIPAYSQTRYTIDQILPNGEFVLLDPDRTLPSSGVNNLNYSLFDDANNEIFTSSTGILTVTLRALVNLNDPYIININQFARGGDLLQYNGVNYTILATTGTNLYIQDYDLGDAVGVGIDIIRPLLTNSIGYFGYSGLSLQTVDDYEAELGILNGQNQTTDPNEIFDDGFLKENFLININGTFFRLVNINKTQMTLGGQGEDWGTLTSGGTTVNFSILRFPQKTVDVQLTVFESGINRSGKETIMQEIDTFNANLPTNVVLTALQLPSDSSFTEQVQQDESIQITIERGDGTTEIRTL